MSLLLLFGGSAGRLGVTAALLALAGPPATLAVSGSVVLQVTAAEVAFSGPTAELKQGFNVDAGLVTFSGPNATLAISGNVALPVTAGTVAFSSGQASIAFDQSQVLFFLNGVARGFRVDSLTITDALDQQPNSCSFLISEVEPLKDQEVIIALGGLNNRIFAGHVTAVDIMFEDSKANGLWSVTCVDYTRLLNRRKVLKRYTNQSATSIVLDILSTYTAGFTSANVATGLATIAEIDFTMEEVGTALTRVAQLIGGSWYVDYFRDLHFFVDAETVDAPEDITDTEMEFFDPNGGEDVTQRRNRVIVEGGGDVASVEVATTENTVPVNNGAWYSTSGGTVKSGAQSFPYTGKSTTDETGSTVAGKLLSLGAPSAAVASGVPGRLGVGAYQYKTTAVMPAGESEVSGASNVATVPDVATMSAPSATPLATAGNLTTGGYQYKIAPVTAAGEGAASAASGTASVTDVAAPSTPSASAAAGQSGNLGVGTFGYKVTNKTAAGETTGSSETTATISAVPSAAVPTAVMQNVPGNLLQQIIGGLPFGQYAYRTTNITALGETLSNSFTSSVVSVGTVSAPSAPSGSGATVAGGGMALGTYTYVVTNRTLKGETVGSSSGSVTLSGTHTAAALTVPTSSDVRVIGRRIYRFANATGGALRYVGEINDNVTGAWTDIVPEANRGAVVPSTNTAGSGKVTVTVPTSSDARVIARGVYRSNVNDTNSNNYRLVYIINDNSTTSFVDDMPEELRGRALPLSNTAGSGRVTVTVPTSGDSRVTQRLVYRTAVGQTDGWKLIGTIGDNVTTTFNDNVSDSSRGAPIPTTNTTGRGQMTVTIPTSGDPRVTGRNVYRTEVNGSVFRRIVTIGNNTATSFVDNASDASQQLGALAPATSTAGSGQVNVTSVALGPPGTTARRIYRTEANGATFRFLRTINDNVTTLFTDNVADTSLGELAPEFSGVGALAGDTILRVKDLAKFPAAGWVRVGDQIIRFTGRSGSSGEGTLTGIPASGVGAIGAGIAAEVSVVNHPHLTGVSGIQFTIKAGDEINVLVTRNNTAAQAALALVEDDGGGGVHEHFIRDSRLNIVSCEKRGDAELALFSDAELRFSFSSRDPNLASGKRVNVNLAPPANMTASLKIQRVTLTQFGIANVMPKRRVTASSYLFTIDQLFRQVELGD